MQAMYTPYPIETPAPAHRRSLEHYHTQINPLLFILAVGCINKSGGQARQHTGYLHRFARFVTDKHVKTYSITPPHPSSYPRCATGANLLRSQRCNLRGERSQETSLLLVLGVVATQNAFENAVTNVFAHARSPHAIRDGIMSLRKGLKDERNVVGAT
jgi:hypothetical protein